ncbi:DUF3995 domain-containing protein [Pleionea sp. CnH1-48]|uniref:DUF3995 domain-containing protein n=1 Tax=Pleionea sp. CnH1-48 TaxID=2954494 RepID=UPI002097E1D7|nr:DUF3995 domain-containing protein [Pleionea sp. CnH1-48]MCO7222931.1 DUF3995 domain-containing protein [Pleionea sp. CnH1-48]
MQLLYILIIFLLFVISSWHFYWAAGGRLGLEAAIPTVDGEPIFQPTALITAVVGILILGLAVLFFGLTFDNIVRSRFGDVLQYMGLFAAAAFMLRAIGDFHVVGFFKHEKSGKFARFDSLLYSPLCLALGVAFSFASF